MQDCFRAHPEIYASELDDDGEEMEGAIQEGDAERGGEVRGEASTAPDASSSKTAAVPDNEQHLAPSVTPEPRPDLKQSREEDH